MADQEKLFGDIANHENEFEISKLYGIPDQNRIRLPDDEWHTFMQALEHPPKPNSALMAAARRYLRV